MTIIVKICGIRTLSDALAAVYAGADMLGFNFYPPSPRYLDPAGCARLVQDLRNAIPRPPVLVGVFVNLPVSEVAEVLRTCDLDLAQLHGDEPVQALNTLGGRSFKAIRPGSEREAQVQVQAYCQPVLSPTRPGILLDASAAGLYGGSGMTANWAVAAALARQTRLLLAGGLNPDNVAEAMAAVRPWGVDVASGVEREPGVKDPAKMKLFTARARAAADYGTN